MNVMLIILIFYIITLVSISFFDFFKVKDFKQFAVAGKNQNIFAVYFSLMATIIGASATIGIADRVTQIGFASFWWLAVGSIGLFLQGMLVSKKIRDIDATTLPDLASITMGVGFGKLIACIIAVSWIGIIAAQFVSIAKLFAIVTGGSFRVILIVAAVSVILYTMLGGQLSVVKTDSIQSWIVFIAIICVFVWLFFVKCSNPDYQGIALDEMRLLSPNFKPIDLITLLFITGGSYFLGPDIISRNIISRDSTVARRSAFLAGITLLFFGIIITLISMWSVKNIPDLNGANPLLILINHVIPFPIAVMLCVGLLSTLLSSVDTCLVNAASIIEHDIIGKDSVLMTRVFIAVLGMFGLLISLFKTDIIGLLLSAYSIYTPAIVFPLFICIMVYQKISPNKILLAAAVIIGAIAGFWQPLVAMTVSCVISLSAIFFGKKIKIN